MKYQTALLTAFALFAAVVLAYCAREQHRARLAIEALVSAQDGQRLVSTVYVVGVETQAITTTEPGWTKQDLRNEHAAFLRALE